MITAEEMRKKSEQGYVKRYTSLIQNIEERIEEAAENGYNSVTMKISDSEYPEFEKSPAMDYLKELTKLGYSYRTEKWIAKLNDSGILEEADDITIIIKW